MDMLEVGKIVNTHGLRGEVKVVPWTDYPEQFEDIDKVFTADGNEYNIKNVKYQKSNIILRFAEIADINDAEKLKGKTLLTQRSALDELPEGVYYVADLIGIKVISDEGEALGEISDVLQTGANDIYEVKRDGKKPLLLPVIDSVVLNVDTQKRIATVHLMEGLLDL